MAPSGLFHVSRRLVVVYALDWLVILSIIAFAGSMSAWAFPNIRPFSPIDPSISFPFQTHPKIPTWLLLTLAIAVPGVVILITVLTVSAPPPPPSHCSSSWTPAPAPSSRLRTKLYTLNFAWLGLLLSIAIAMLFTDGVKNLIGKPRPDMLARCDPDPELFARFAIGGGKKFWEAVDQKQIAYGGLVEWGVCRNLGRKGSNGGLGGKGVVVLGEKQLRDGFRSFPSGHSSMSFAGLTYLSIFLATYLFRLPIRHLPTPSPHHPHRPQSPGDSPASSPHPAISTSTSFYHPLNHHHQQARRRSIPIIPSILATSLPVLTATYIATTRVSDFRHAGFDVLFGVFVGLVAAAIGWRGYGAVCVREAAAAGVYEGGGGSVDEEGVVPVLGMHMEREVVVVGGAGGGGGGKRAGGRRTAEGVELERFE